MDESKQVEWYDGAGTMHQWRDHLLACPLDKANRMAARIYHPEDRIKHESHAREHGFFEDWYNELICMRTDYDPNPLTED